MYIRNSAGRVTATAVAAVACTVATTLVVVPTAVLTARADATITTFVVPGKKKAPWEADEQRPDAEYLPMNSNFYDFAAADVQIFPYSRAAWPLTGLDTPTYGSAVREGSQDLTQQILATDGKIVVAAHSEGAVLADNTQRQLADDPSAPARGDLIFILSADHQRSTPLSNALFTYLPTGHIPVLDYDNQRPPESKYDTIVIVSEYDGYADFPDRPWNALAVANALMGISVVHSSTMSADPAQIPTQNTTTTHNSLGGTTTTYLVPTPTLPLLSPLEGLGVPEPVVATLNSALKPVVDAGYSRNDEPGSWRPYLKPSATSWPTVEVAALHPPRQTELGTADADAGVVRQPRTVTGGTSTSRVTLGNQPTTAPTQMTSPRPRRGADGGIPTSAGSSGPQRHGPISQTIGKVTDKLRKAMRGNAGAREADSAA